MTSKKNDNENQFETNESNSVSNDSKHEIPLSNDANLKESSTMQRRDFLSAAIGSIAAASVLANKPANAQTSAKNLNQEPSINISDYALEVEDELYEVAIIGSGFGGAVSAARTSKRWPGKVLMIERGKRYGRGDFPRTFNELTNGFWRIPGDNVPRLFPLWGEQRGVFDFRSYDHMDTLVASGYGGGSLIYGAGIIEPVSEYFDEDWPASIRRDQLTPYYEVFKHCLGAQTLPETDEPARQLNRKALYETIATHAAKERKDIDVSVFFGNDPANPSDAGVTELNRYGAEQTSCNYCGECIIGCNTQSKNSLDLNYLYVAENHFGMKVKTEHMVEKIVPLDKYGEESTQESGEHGYHIYTLNLESKTSVRVKSKRVILSAGTYGSNEILMKNKQAYKTLPRVSDQIGQKYSGNGDFITLTWGSEMDTDVNKGPTITQYIDHTSGVSEKSQQFIAEDMAIPLHVLGDIIELVSPSMIVRRHFQEMLSQTDDNSDLIVQVHVGMDNAGGEVSLNWQNGLRLNWPYYENMNLYRDIIDATKMAKEAVNGKGSLAFPTWIWPFRRNLTVHPLGGCVLADTEAEGVVSASRGEMGRVFNYQNLYVSDGSIVPSSLGANPSITIGALAEVIAEDITGMAADMELV